MYLGRSVWKATQTSINEHPARIGVVHDTFLQVASAGAFNTKPMIMLIYLEANLDKVITEALSRAQISYPMYFAADVRDMPARSVFTVSAISW